MGYKFKFVGGNVENCIMTKEDGQVCFRYSRTYPFKYVPIVGNIANITQVTEENKKSFTGSAAWGLVGALALGGIGALAGVLAGGNSKELLVAIQLKSGENILGTVDMETFKWLVGVAATPGAAARPVKTLTDKMEDYTRQQEQLLKTMTPEQIAANEKKGKQSLVLMGLFVLVVITAVYFLLH